MTESVLDGVTGYLVERSDVDGLAHALTSLINDPASARAMGAAGSSWVRTHCSIEPYVAGLTERYRASIERRQTST